MPNITSPAKLVRIVWDDICSPKETWMSLKEAMKWAVKRHGKSMSTTGYLIYETSEYILVAATHDAEDDDYGDISMIPKGTIRKIVPLS